MRKNTAKTVASIVANSTGKLSNIIQRARQLESLNSQVNQYISHPLGSHCQVANLRDNRIIVLVDSPVWAARLRYEKTHILNKLRLIEGFPRIDELSIQVKPATGKRKPAQNRNKLTAASREHIQELAEEIEDQKLRESLLRLATRTKTEGS